MVCVGDPTPTAVIVLLFFDDSSSVCPVGVEVVLHPHTVIGIAGRNIQPDPCRLVFLVRSGFQENPVTVVPKFRSASGPVGFEVFQVPPVAVTVIIRHKRCAFLIRRGGNDHMGCRTVNLHVRHGGEGHGKVLFLRPVPDRKFQRPARNPNREIQIRANAAVLVTLFCASVP